MSHAVGYNSLFVHVYDADMTTLIPTLLSSKGLPVKEPLIVSMFCAEHHRVPVLYGSRTKVDGYTFKDPQGALWHNEYPRPYTSDFPDRGKNLIVSEAKDEHGSSQVLELLTSYLARVLSAMEYARKNPERWEKLSDHYVSILDALYEHGYHATSKNVEVRFQDGSKKTFPSLFEVKLVSRFKTPEFS